ncbi:MAG: hypothetical protein MJ248_07245, partial [Bacilli bacterium]|nr:hypothetical protein [Bacilli bacterium]
KFLCSAAIYSFYFFFIGGKLLLNGNAIDDVKVYGIEDRKVKIAVRPESFEYVAKGGNIPVTVTSIEHIGRDITVNGNITSQENHIKVIIRVK